jgi:hypothetical protein
MTQELPIFINHAITKKNIFFRSTSKQAIRHRQGKPIASSLSSSKKLLSYRQPIGTPIPRHTYSITRLTI